MSTLELPEGWCNAPEQSQHRVGALKLAQSGVEEACSSCGCHITAIDEVWQQLAEGLIRYVLLGLVEIWHSDVVPEPADEEPGCNWVGLG